jgi:hypothetical protein
VIIDLEHTAIAARLPGASMVSWSCTEQKGGKQEPGHPEKLTNLDAMTG